MSEFKGAVRVQPIQVVRVLWADDERIDDAERERRGDPRNLLREVSSGIQRIKNRFYFAVRQWHEVNGSGPKVRQWFADYLAWARAAKAERAEKPPQCPVRPIPAECSRYVYAEVTRAAPLAHSRCVALSLNRESGDLAKRKAVGSGFARWQRMVADLGEMPTFSSPQPIPFSLENASLETRPVSIETAGRRREVSEWSLVVRLDRDDAGKSHPIRLVLRTGGRKLEKIGRVLERCARYQHFEKRRVALRAKMVATEKATTKEEKAAREQRIKQAERDLRAEYLGETLWKFCGSMVVERDRGWEVHVCYQEEEPYPVEVDPNRRAVLRASRKHPWTLRINGRSRWIGGRGHLVEYTRRTCGDQRRSRQESYRYGSKSRRGHGYRRAIPALANREDALKKTLNGQAVAAVLRLLVENGVGRLVFRQPKESVARTRYLSTAGACAKYPGTWPWYQVETMLAQKTAAMGIELVTASKKREAKKGRKGKSAKG